MQAALLRDLHETASPKLPNIFLVDISTDEVAGVKEFFQRQPEWARRPARPGSDAGGDRPVSLAQRQAGGATERAAFSARLLENAELSWADALGRATR